MTPAEHLVLGLADCGVPITDPRIDGPLVRWSQKARWRNWDRGYDDVEAAVYASEVVVDAHPHWLMLPASHPKADWGGGVEVVTEAGGQWRRYSFGTSNYWPDNPNRDIAWQARAQQLYLKMSLLACDRYESRAGKWRVRYQPKGGNNE